MAAPREIRAQISSIKTTQKITNAMQMVAASKIQKAQIRMRASLPYAEKIREVIGRIACSHSEFRHPYMKQPERISRVALIVISSDRGLCGGLNSGLFKYLLNDYLETWRRKNIEVDLCLIGYKAFVFFHQHAYKIVSHLDHVGDVPVVADLIGAIKVLLDAYYQGNLQGLYVAHNDFITTMSQKPRVEQLLPLLVTADELQGHYWDYIYEPETKVLLDRLLRRYIESNIYQAVIDNIACEQAARMVAMQSATENAGEIVTNLQLIYNKARQAAITQEISEIVAGAAAV